LEEETNNLLVLKRTTWSGRERIVELSRHHDHCSPDQAFFHQKQKNKMEAKQDVARAQSQKDPNALTRRHATHAKRANHIARDVKVDCIIEYLGREN
jgi:hypothetical protein